MNDGGDAAVEAVCDALADEDCRAILRALDEPLTAAEVASACDLPQTSTYRKLTKLTDAGLVAERTEVRTDGHHTTRFVRDAASVVVAFDDGQSFGFSVEVVREDEPPDRRLEQLWTRISEEL
ncbi:helix-turn-helix domain-containing protein [Salinigranum sp. GCM10025319]|uniref:helix-turn-helix domain-containing protein n=1 Tax=Salinigranum sp. GCM10025319 TaxID=3252687 RepID=UPI00361CA594